MNTQISDIMHELQRFDSEAIEYLGENDIRYAQRQLEEGEDPDDVFRRLVMWADEERRIIACEEEEAMRYDHQDYY